MCSLKSVKFLVRPILNQGQANACVFWGNYFVFQFDRYGKKRISEFSGKKYFALLSKGISVLMPEDNKRTLSDKNVDKAPKKCTIEINPAKYRSTIQNNLQE